MDYLKSEKIATIKIKNREFHIFMSNHSIERMVTRGIDRYTVSGSILSLGERIFDISVTGYDEGIIIDSEKKVAIVFAVEKFLGRTVVKVITVISKDKVFVKNNTKIFNI